MKNFISKMGCKAIGALLIAFAGAQASAATYTATVNGTTYDFTTVAGTANDNMALLSAQPWWGDAALARSFATAVWDGLGTPVYDVLSPMFAYRTNQGQIDGYYLSSSNINGISQGLTMDWGFAVAQVQQVPEIDGALLPQALALMGASALFIRRRRVV